MIKEIQESDQELSAVANCTELLKTIDTPDSEQALTGRPETDFAKGLDQEEYNKLNIIEIEGRKKLSPSDRMTLEKYRKLMAFVYRFKQLMYKWTSEILKQEASRLAREEGPDQEILCQSNSTSNHGKWVFNFALKELKNPEKYLQLLVSSTNRCMAAFKSLTTRNVGP